VVHVDQGEVLHPRSGKRLGSPRANATNPHHQRVGLANPLRWTHAQQAV
jgi:hypothetical protein